MPLGGLGERFCVVDKCLDEPAISLTQLFLPTWPGVRFYYIGNVVAFLSGKIDKVTPIGLRYQAEIFLNQIAHE